MSQKMIARLAAGALLVALAAGAAVLSGALETSVVGKDIEKPLSPDEIAALAPRGRYLAQVADCYGCHTATKGPALAGGVTFKTPFGVINATNITPDKETGIGGWSRADFHRALRDGIAPGGRRLYPAMPYDSYRHMSAADVDAIYAFLTTRESIRRQNADNDLLFPFSIRHLLAFWNVANLSRAEFKPEPAQTPQWNRGRYIVDALGHCGACHTPRDWTQGSSQSRYLQGGMVDGVEAPDITAAGLTRLGFNASDFQKFMRSGLSAQGSMTNKMFDVVHFSTQYLNDADASAMTAYLLGDAKPEPIAAHGALAPEVAVQGRRVYSAACAGCHGRDGEGLPHVSVPMTTNVSLRLTSPRNFLNVVLHGLPEQRFPGLERMQPMPGFAEKLSPGEVAALTNWMRATWGGQPPTVEATDIGNVRRRPD